MKLPAPAVVAVVLVLSGCRTAHDVAVDSYRVATAPVNLVRPKSNQSTTTVTTTTTTSEAPESAGSAESVRPLPRPSPESKPRTTASTPTQNYPDTPPGNPRTTSSPRPSSSQLDFPKAKPVEGKPGYVYSPFDAGKYVDVSGYAPGSKVKDPYSGKIFVVP